MQALFHNYPMASLKRKPTVFMWRRIAQFEYGDKKSFTSEAERRTQSSAARVCMQSVSTRTYDLARAAARDASRGSTRLLVYSIDPMMMFTLNIATESLSWLAPSSHRPDGSNAKFRVGPPAQPLSQLKLHASDLMWVERRSAFHTHTVVYIAVLIYLPDTCILYGLKYSAKFADLLVSTKFRTPFCP